MDQSMTPTFSTTLPAAMIGTTSMEPPQTHSIECQCHKEKLQVVHAYLKRHFVDHVLGDLHAPSRLRHTPQTAQKCEPGSLHGVGATSSGLWRGGQGAGHQQRV
jgi:hypothetical protein